MKKFKVQIGLVKRANKALINSNKLKHVFYNIGNNFIVNNEDLSDCIEILDRNMIKVNVISY
jgi:hypothetical protein